MRNQAHSVLLDQVRLSELGALHLLDTPSEEAFDRLTRLSARLLAAPIALVSLVDDHRQFFKSSFGLPEPWASLRETPLSHSFCQHVVTRATPLIIEDARRHPLVRNNGAIAALNIIAYLGIPLTLQSGVTVGSFCVMDTRPRTWTASDVQTMTDLAASVTSELALRIACDERTRLINQLCERDALLQAAQQLAQDEQGVIAVIQRVLKDMANNGSQPHATSLEAQRALLTIRQREVFDLLMHGYQTKQVAQELNLSPRTVEVHRAHILARLNVTSFSHLLRQLLHELDPR